MGADSRKQSLYFPGAMLGEMQREASRQDRSLSWIVQQAWRVARSDIRRMPSPNDIIPPMKSDPFGEKLR